MIRYLSALEMNNERDWYHANKSQLIEVRGDFEQLVQEFIFRIGENDPSVMHNIAKASIYRLTRDLRFSHNKTPYNPAFRASISPQAKLQIPVGYYLELRPDDRSMLCGGLFADCYKDATEMVRDYIVEHGKEWMRIITAPSFTKYFTVEGSALKNVPRGYDKAHPQAEFLKNKNWYIACAVSDTQLSDAEGFVDFAVEVFAAMQPFNAFLNRALVGFQMPEKAF